MRFLILSALLLAINVTFACECGLEGASTRIFKGTKARANKYPWLAHIRVWPSKQSRIFMQCGGSLIDESHVVTAAHCVTDESGKNVKSKSNIEVFLGRVKSLSGQSEPISVSAVWVDPKFDLITLSHDFAILTLSKSVVYSQTVGPICLPNKENNLSKLMITGWGKTFDGSATSDDLMEAEVDYINRKNCDELKKYYAMRANGYPKFMKDLVRVDGVSETHLCAVNKETGANICQGDSGGPIMHKGSNERYYLMGITSGLWSKCGEVYEDVSGLFTRTFYYKKTIESMAPNACWQD